MFSVLSLTGDNAELRNKDLIMARSAAFQDEDPRAALLEAQLRAWFAALSAQPVPTRILRHVDRLDREGPGFSRPAPETR